MSWRQCARCLERSEQTPSPRWGAGQLQSVGFSCPPPTRLVGKLSWVMNWRSAGADYNVEIVGTSADEVERVSASFLGYAPDPPDVHAKTFRRYVATIPYQAAD